MTGPPPRPQWNAAFRHRPFALYLAGRFLSTFAVQIISVAVGWQVYDLTRDPLDLGLVGLAQFLPSLLLVLVTGSVADRFDRRAVMALCIVAEGLCVLALLLLTIRGPAEVWPVFAVLVGFGVARAFFSPASQSLLPNLVPPADLANAIAWTSSSWQIATIVGPALGGVLYGFAGEAAYGAALAMLGAAALSVALVPRPPQRMRREPATWTTIVAGFRYVWREKLVLGAISLDLFAVLLGGATALLPVYARDILEVGPWGLGLLRAGPGLGAILMATWLTVRPIRTHAGVVMFVSVALFGLATVVFGVSVAPWLSIVALAIMGATDMISVYVRETLIQIWTPDEVRGRVNAVNMVFIGASNEVGEFRAGVSAALIGTVAAVVVGGVGTMAVAALWARWFPQLREVQRLDQR